MKIETKNNTEVSFTEGDIVALKVDCDGSKTDIENYYLIVEYNTTYDCLVDIKRGEMYMYQNYSSTRYLNRADLMDLIERYDGKVYKGDKAKLILKNNN